MSVHEVVVAQVPIDSPDGRDLIQALDDDLRGRYPGAPIQGLRPEDGMAPRFAFFVARVDGGAVGCGAVRALEGDAGEVKRMFVRAEYRGRGIARRILLAIEAKSRELGYSTLRLETGPGQPEAIGLYLSAGYVPIPPFGEYVGNTYSRCFEKPL